MKLADALAHHAWRRDPRTVRVLVGVAFVLSLVTTVVGLLDAARFIGRPFPQFGYTEMRLISPPLFGPSGGDQPDLRLWDQIETVDGVPLEDARELTLLLQARQPGSSVVLRLRELDGRRKETRVTLTAFSVGDFFRWHTNQVLLALVILAVGALVWARRSGPRALTFSLTCIAFALMCVGGVDGTLFRRIPHLFHFSAPLVPAAGMAFAVTLSPRLSRQRRGVVVWGLPLLLGLVLSALLVVFHGGPVRVYAALGAAVYAWLCIGALGFFLVMLDAWRRPESPLDGARAGVIVLTWPLGMAVPALNFLLGFTLPRWEITAIPNLFIMLIPLGVAYAIFRQDLFEADLSLRRLIAELLLTALSTAAYALSLTAAYSIMKEDAASPAVSVALAALLLSLAVPLRAGLSRHLDRLVEWRRYDAHEALAHLAQSLSTELSLDRALGRIQEVLSSTVHPGSCAVVLRDMNGQLQKHALMGQIPAVPEEAWRSTALVLSQPPGFALDPEPADDGDVRLAALPVGVELVVPLRAAGRDVGALLLGPPLGRQIPFSTADLMFVRAVAGQAAPTLANALVFDEVDRLNRTLEERVRERTAELTAVNEELRMLDKRKDELISTVSHDFRSPLSIIRSHVDTLLTDPLMDTPTRETFLRVIDRQARRLSSMVENLLDLARIRNRGLSAGVLDVREVLRLVADTARPRMDAAHVQFAVAVPSSRVCVSGDLERLGQVFHNLLDNAAKFTRPGGTVRLYAQAEQHRVSFGVSDTGIGIPEDDQPHVLEPFYQVKRAGAEREGSGLGLAIVKEIVERHGSTLRLVSGPGGTTVEFSLPVCPVP
jgi:signal transduction histidine kinase